VSGTFILATQVIMPLVAFKTEDSIAKPVSSTVLGAATGFSDFQYTELGTGKTAASVMADANIPQFFKLAIPKLGITSANVETNSTNLSPDTALGHYKGTALPGEPGNAFIYGHSVLPWFFNPKNYKTIFATLENLSVGDSIIIKYNNKKLTYKVEAKKVVKPEEVNVFAEYKPKYLNESTVTLMTCVPAGTKLRRLLVYAVLSSSK